MKFVHLSDLHLGINIYGVSMIEEQKYILNEILDMIAAEKPDGVLIAGDVYDTKIPSVEAVNLMDDFLTSLSNAHIPVYLISGNHDSADRVSFGARIFSNSKVHIASAYTGNIERIDLKDEYGPLHLYMLPFVKPAQVRAIFPDEEINSPTDAMNVVIGQAAVNNRERNILITHQFITGSTVSDSESYAVGGADNVDAGVFDGFDYVALGHIHKPQEIGRKTLRYCGTPLKYSFSEVSHSKSLTIVEMAEKGNVELRVIPLTPQRDMKDVSGIYQDLMKGKSSDDYVRVILKDEDDIPDASNHLRGVFPNLLHLEYDNLRTRHESGKLTLEGGTEMLTPLDIFSDFFEDQNGQAMSDYQLSLIKDLIDKVWGGEA